MSDRTAETGAIQISVVAPVYNERENIRVFVKEVLIALEALDNPGPHELILVNDGSTDGTEDELDACAKDHPGVLRVLHLARNFGMEPAIEAGLDRARGEAVIVLDSDLQDDPSAFAAFVEKWREGYDVVYAVRSSRQESLPRRALFSLFYRVLGHIAQIDLPVDASNFALIDRNVADALRAMPERNRFLRGLRAWVGYRQIGVPVARRARHAHRTRLGLRGQWKLAMNAIFAFSYVPLFVFRFAGLIALIFSLLLIAWALYYKLVVGLDIKAWASLLIATSFLGGINLLGIGVIGEYVARIHDEVKGRPNYIVRRSTEFPPAP
ncbi:MAG: glycosyltransferase family 2 protein [Candidatus Hydrogenedentes bacterium]|nr:glycosyltransferase family 2 protein [Candidatus Hydrogenedentota bacterium]